jgi:hypothetical protein
VQSQFFCDASDTAAFKVIHKFLDVHAGKTWCKNHSIVAEVLHFSSTPFRLLWPASQFIVATKVAVLRLDQARKRAKFHCLIISF